MKYLSSSVISALTLVGGAAAWGATGHQTVGYVAQAFLAPKALSFVKSSLGSTYSQSLGPAATWADEVRSQAAYKWSAPLHFVDAEDAPLSGSCSVSQTRDCANGQCILGAIANYTARVAQTSLSAAQRQEALKFLDHFIGDIGQPLHVEAYEVGGNDISVKCSGSTSNLHSVWDSGMINKKVDANYGDAASWAAALVARIQSGAYKSLAPGWISCSSTTTPASRRSGALHELAERGASIDADVRSVLVPRATVKPLACPLVWAQDANAYDCSFVFTYTAGSDLCTSSYYTNAIPIIELQIAKQGYRLAAWLNVIFDGATNL